MPVFEIDNIDDPRLDEYRDIRDRDLRQHGLDGGLFVAAVLASQRPSRRRH